MGDQYHEPAGELSGPTRDLTRVLVSLKEEIEAIDWYNQRIELASDEQVKRLLRHNQEEEMEHAAMALEHLRRTMPGWGDALRTYLFTEGELTELEDEAMGRAGVGGSRATDEALNERGSENARLNDSARGLGIGNLKGGNA